MAYISLINDPSGLGYATPSFFPTELHTQITSQQLVDDETALPSREEEINS